MERLMISVLTASFALIASAGEYDSYVWLSSSDDASSSSFFDNANKRWKKKGPDGNYLDPELQGPHAGEKYYVPTDVVFATSNVVASAGNPIEYVFGGDELTLSHRLYIILKRSNVAVDDACVRIDNLVLLPNGHFYNANEKIASVSGTCTVMGTKSKPSFWFNCSKNGRPILKSKLIGTSSSYFRFRDEPRYSEGKMTIFKYLGDATEYYGTLFLNTDCAQLTVGTPGGFSCPGTIDIKNRAVLHIPADNTATIENLVSSNGIVSIGADNVNSLYGKLFINNKINFNKEKISVYYPRVFRPEAENVELIRLASGSSSSMAIEDFDISGFSVEPERLAVCTNAWMPNISFSVKEVEDGSRVLSASHRKYVYIDAAGKEGSESIFLQGNVSSWSDDGEISPENDYYIGVGDKGCYPPTGSYAFKGASLTLCDTGKLFFKNAVDFTVQDFRWVASLSDVVHLQSWNSSSTIYGNITIPKVLDKVFHVQSWNGGDPKNGKEYTHSFTIASELHGDGTLGLVSNSTSADARAFYHITGENNNFAGRIHLFHDAFGGDNKEKFEADPDKYCVTLYVSDSSNLGGPMQSFDKASLLLANHSLLKTKGSLTFDEPTRGWSINGVGRVHVYADETLAIANKQITYSGEFRKEGEGLLKLGGTARFTEGALETPLEGTNILSIAAGSVMPADVTAFDGLEVRFAAGAKLMLDLSATGDLAKYGMYNMKWDNPVVVDGGAALPVHLKLPENFDKDAKYSFGVITVNPVAAAGIDADEIAVKVPTGMKASISKVENADENGNVVSVTYVCSLSRAAFVVVVR